MDDPEPLRAQDVLPRHAMQVMERPSSLNRPRQVVRRLGRDERAAALIEFAFTLPLLLAVGCWGVELSSFALANLRVSQYALNLADSASRVGTNDLVNGGITDFREVDANDVLQGARIEGAALNLTTNGRITLTSLENVQQTYDKNGPVQRIHWQRCLGARGGANDPGFDTSYQTVSTTAGQDGTQANAGVQVANYGPASAPVSAPLNTGVMFVEINYYYQPLFGTVYMNPRIIHYVASFIVRDNRSFVQIYNPSPTTTGSTCDLHTKGVGGATT